MSSVLNVTESDSGSSRRSNAARLVRILRPLRFGKVLLSHCGFDVSGQNALDGVKGGKIFGTVLLGYHWALRIWSGTSIMIGDTVAGQALFGALAVGLARRECPSFPRVEGTRRFKAVLEELGTANTFSARVRGIAV